MLGTIPFPATTGSKGVDLVVNREDFSLLNEAKSGEVTDIKTEDQAKLAENRALSYEKVILMYDGSISEGSPFEYFVVIKMYEGVGDFLKSVINPLGVISTNFAQLSKILGPIASWINILITAVEGLKYTAGLVNQIQPYDIKCTRDQLTVGPIHGAGGRWDREARWNKDNYMREDDYPTDFIKWQRDKYSVGDLSCTDRELDLIRWYGQGGYVMCAGSTVGGYGFGESQASGLPVELAYMDYLATKEKEAWGESNAQEAIRLLYRQRDFIKNHLNWIEEFSRQIGKTIEDEYDQPCPNGWKYYNELIGNLATFVDADKELLEELCEYYSIKGRVVDSKGKPIEGVLVRTKVDSSDAYDVTSPSGDFKISMLPSGTYTLKASKEGYETEIKKVRNGEIVEFIFGTQAPDITTPPPTWSPEEPEGDIPELIDEFIAWWTENKDELFKAAHEFVNEIFEAIDELISEYQKEK